MCVCVYLEGGGVRQSERKVCMRGIWSSIVVDKGNEMALLRGFTTIRKIGLVLRDSRADSL